ncbi:MAG TPA: segregation/condensation protein A [Anaerolineales bacterium]
MYPERVSPKPQPYTVSTPVYQGPLDLLLHLIERAELDITRLALAQVTDQFLAYINNMPELSADEVSAFLVIAAKLIQIKSEALLPRPPVREEGEEDPGEALARQLLEYRRYKYIADFLSQKEELGLQTYLRLAPPPRIEGVVDLSEIHLDDLVAAAQAILHKIDPRSSLNSVVSPSPVTIRQKISRIARILRLERRVSFFTLLNGARTRLDIVVTFLAILELIKQKIVLASQTMQFGNIEIEALKEWDEGVEFELEFDD